MHHGYLWHFLAHNCCLILAHPIFTLFWCAYMVLAYPSLASWISIVLFFKLKKIPSNLLATEIPRKKKKTRHEKSAASSVAAWLVPCMAGNKLGQLMAQRHALCALIALLYVALATWEADLKPDFNGEKKGKSLASCRWRLLRCLLAKKI